METLYHPAMFSLDKSVLEKCDNKEWRMSTISEFKLKNFTTNQLNEILHIHMKYPTEGTSILLNKIVEKYSEE